MTAHEELRKTLSDASDKDLKEIADKYKVEIKKDAKRSEVEEDIYKKILSETTNNGKATKEETKKEKAEEDKVDKITVQYLSKGSCKVNGVTWKGLSRRSLNKKEARLLTTKFPKRFKIIK